MKSETGTLTRRGFTQMLGAGAALAALRPPFALGARRAPTTRLARAVAPVVRLSSNENPYGPSPAALSAMTEAFGLAWRYPDEHQDTLVEELSKQHGVGMVRVLRRDACLPVAEQRRDGRKSKIGGGRCEGMAPCRRRRHLATCWWRRPGSSRP